MNWFVIGAGIVALFATVGHFLMGSKDFLNPMLNASFDPVPKKVMHSVFHYVSVFLTLSALALLAIGFGLISDNQPSLLVRFLALNYAFFAIWQIVIALNSGIEKGVFKLFQWVFWAIIAILAWFGA